MQRRDVMSHRLLTVDVDINSLINANIRQECFAIAEIHAKSSMKVSIHSSKT